MLGNKKVMGRNIQRYMDKLGIERKELAKAIGVPYSSLTDWINGKTYPRIDKIEKLANYFGVSKSDLVEERPDGAYYLDPAIAKKAQEMFEDPDMRSLFDMKKNMDPGKFQLQMDYLRGLYKLEHPEDSDEGC